MESRLWTIHGGVDQHGGVDAGTKESSSEETSRNANLLVIFHGYCYIYHHWNTMYGLMNHLELPRNAAEAGSRNRCFHTHTHTAQVGPTLLFPEYLIPFTCTHRSSSCSRCFIPPNLQKGEVSLVIPSPALFHTIIYNITDPPTSPLNSRLSRSILMDLESGSIHMIITSEPLRPNSIETAPNE